jgi:hypothetical protein
LTTPTGPACEIQAHAWRQQLTTVQIELPAELAQEAAQAGLLSCSVLEAWLRERLAQMHLRRAVTIGLDAAQRGEFSHIDTGDVGAAISAIGLRAQARADGPR